jgi:hypothetical protein
MPLTILSDDGKHRAIVSETDEGAAIAFYRLVVNGSRGLAPGETKTKWRYLRTSIIPQPFHVALDVAHAIVRSK